MSQINVYQFVVAILGAALIIGGISCLFSRRFYAALNKAFFFEKVSEADKRKLSEYKQWQRIGVGGIMLFWGIAAAAWVFGWNFVL